MECACVAPAMLDELCKRCMIVELPFSDHGTEEMLGVVGSNV